MSLLKLRQFPAGVIEKLECYVYLYFDPRDPKRPFYIGKGEGNRLFSHLSQADGANTVGRKVERIRSILSSGLEPHLVLHRYGLTKKEAFEIEAGLIDLFPDAENEISGHESHRGTLPLSEVIAHFRAAEAAVEFPCVVFTVRKLWPGVYKFRKEGNEAAYQKALFNATRASWKVSPKRRPNIKHAIAFAGGVIRQVYQIERWREADVDGAGNPAPPHGRMMFDGTASLGHQHLIGCTLPASQLPKPGAQMPFRYLNG
jgi:uncharacterized protein